MVGWMDGWMSNSLGFLSFKDGIQEASPGVAPMTPCVPLFVSDPHASPLHGYISSLCLSGAQAPPDPLTGPICSAAFS